jgi:predicted CXXCH cytochrome family protein
MLCLGRSGLYLVRASLLVLLLPVLAWAVQDVVNTRHNLSVSGPGTIKSATVDAVCVFCHTPHAAQPEAPLWNHQLPSGQTYTPYDSSTLDSAPKPGQPTGKSILCLACHDGTVALGALANPPTGQTMDLGGTFLTPADRGYLGTDLADDHPISFLYDNNLAIADGELATPGTIDLPLESGELQCTSCHDPHEKDVVPFLRKASLNGVLCTTCHVRGQGLAWDWASSSHATSPAVWGGGGTDPWGERRPAWKGSNVAENACFNCHRPHTAATPRRLIKADEENTCYLCHNGNVAGTDIQTEFLKAYSHPVATTPNPNHDATLVENPLTMPFHAECADCHNPHAVKSGLPMVAFDPSQPFAGNHSTPPFANDRIKGVSGLDVNGNVLADITNQYELCFKCHGVPGRGPCGGGPTQRCSTLGTSGHNNVRLDAIYNIRDKVYSGTPGLVSYHPIESNNPANNSEVPSLRTDIPLDKVNSLIYCTDCHNNNVSIAAGGTGPAGPHGSTHEGLFAQAYTLDPLVPAAATNDMALCFKCHDENTLLNLETSGFSHGRHINSRSKTCINCHDPHGSHASPHLINFLKYSNFPGGPYEILATSFAEPTFVDNGVYSGTCYLQCHGTRHDPRGY